MFRDIKNKFSWISFIDSTATSLKRTCFCSCQHILAFLVFKRPKCLLIMRTVQSNRAIQLDAFCANIAQNRAYWTIQNGLFKVMSLVRSRLLLSLEIDSWTSQSVCRSINDHPVTFGTCNQSSRDQHQFWIHSDLVLFSLL